MAKKLKLVKGEDNGKRKKIAEPGAKDTGAEVKKTGRKAPPKSPINLGKTTGLSIGKFQNKTLEDNRKAKLTDEELATLWCEEFPNSVAVQRGNIDANMVRAVRNLYNLGKHGNDAPAKPLVGYDDEGNEVAAWGSKAEAKRAAAAEAKEETKTQKAGAKKGVVKPLGKKVKKG